MSAGRARLSSDAGSGYDPPMAKPSLKKRFGQHHLRGGEMCRPLLDYLQPRGRRVVEIGPGGGVLSAELLRLGGRVIALEVDEEWAIHLQRALPDPQLSIVVTDARRFPWQRLPKPTLITGNLPFNVATHLIEAILAHGEVIDRAAFMVQKEVAERLVAHPGDSAYGALSVLVAAQAKVDYLGTLPAHCFRPPPKVDAAYVGFELLPGTPPEERLAFRRLLHLAFGQRRKTLRNCLASGWGKELAAEILKDASIDGGRRAETLGLEEFRALFSASLAHPALARSTPGRAPGKRSRRR